MKAVCKRRFDVAAPDMLDPARLSLVDHRHRLTYCWMGKSGCSSLKAFILEANGLDLSKYDQLTDDVRFVHLVEIVNKYGLQQMYQINVTQRKHVVDSYFNIMSIRHPFERLVAYYRDKIINSDNETQYFKRPAEILREFRPQMFKNNSTLAAMKHPQDAIGPPTFRETLSWIYEHKITDDHFNIIYQNCHPCAHDWGAILRVETMTQDGTILAKAVNSSRRGVPVRHSHQQNPATSQFTKALPQFEGIPDEVVEYFLEYFRTDMIMFGYRWDKQTNTAYCRIQTPDGPCC